MKSIISAFLLILVAIISSSWKNGNKKLRIEGSISDMKATKIYVRSNEPYLDFLDSAKVIDGKFTLEHNPIDESVMVEVYYINAKGKKQNLYFLNSIDNILLKQFILDNGTTKLNGSILKVIVTGSKENVLYQERAAELMSNKAIKYNRDGTFKNDKIIIDNSQSTYLLHSLYACRSILNSNELNRQLNLFNPLVKATKTGQNLQKFIANLKRTEKSTIDGTYVFYDNAGKKVRLIDLFQKGKLNLYIFWASWCEPCRKEIPELKKFYSEYMDRLNVVSLSIDDKFIDWKSAVSEDNVPWASLSSLPLQKGNLKKRFFINAVPQMLLVDNNGKKLLSVVNDLDSIKQFVLKRKNGK